tara:strand:+ start:612 stop:965 length:354 start_codon:yes stop_codon:yes gene_type:complete
MDAADYGVLSAEVEGEGHQVIWASDGQEAVELTLARKPDLVFLDPALPIFGGYEVAVILRGDPEVPSSLALLLFSDEAQEPHRFDGSGFTDQFRKTHAHQEVREILSQFSDVPPATF